MEISMYDILKQNIDFQLHFVTRSLQLLIKSAGNLGQWHVLVASRMAPLNANGVEELVSSFLVITCYVKSLPETPLVLFVLGRDPCVAVSAREPGFVLSGWENPQVPSDSYIFSKSCRNRKKMYISHDSLVIHHHSLPILFLDACPATGTCINEYIQCRLAL
ncbi:hypothetical protein LINGRAHAP2_LOCUS7964 [Linum grandiflorum]